MSGHSPHNSTDNKEAITVIRQWEKTLGSLLPIAVTLVGAVVAVLWSRMDSLDRKFENVQAQLSSIEKQQITKDDLKEFKITLIGEVGREIEIASLRHEVNKKYSSKQYKEEEGGSPK